MEDIVIVDGARTPFGTYGGTLKDVSATELGVIAARAALERSGADPQLISQVIFGNVAQSSRDAVYTARHIGLKAGVPIDRPALLVNRACGSGLEAILCGARLILLGEADFVLAGGTESMSQVPHVVRGARWGLPFAAETVLEDYLWSVLVDTYPTVTPMAITAENLAERYHVTRQEQDEFSLASQQRAKAGWDEGRLAEEVVPVPVTDRKGNVTLFARDEHLRPETTLEGLAKLKPRFKQGGIVTAGTSSGIVDGAAAVVVTSARKATEHGLKPLGRIVSWGTAGVDPEIMGIGPAPATRIALEKAGLRMSDLDVIEVNEAFGAQCLAVVKDLDIDRDRLNVNGGAIAIGHPLGATGVRTTLTALYELRRRKARYGLSTMCIGGGQGIAAIVENLQR